MKLQYFKAEQGNFGDDLNEWLWTSLHPEIFDDDVASRFVGIGTIIGQPLPPGTATAIVFSSGIGYRPPPAQPGPHHIYVAVRGPLTARVLGLPPEKAVGDGALLLSRIAGFEPLPDAQRTGTILIPHFEKMGDATFLAAVKDAGITLVDPRGDARQVIGSIRSAGKVLADSMHAAIIADTLSVPWVPLASSKDISSFKWLDWARSVGVPYKPTLLPAGSLAGTVERRLKPFAETDQFVGANERTALKNYSRISAERLSPGQDDRKYRVCHRIGRIAKAVGHLADTQAIVRGVDRRQSEKLAKSLVEANEKTGYLSDQSRRSEIADKLAFLLGKVVANPGDVSADWPRL